ncbi:MAG: HAD family hydrolase [Thermoguttaceae bacterium]|jgi:HAD superfamily hydrolase (TIGR01509 family)
MSIEFIYFDLGNVLVYFELERVLAQIAAAAKLARDEVASALFDHGLQREFELGRIGPEEYFKTFRELTGTKSDLESIRRAATEIFWLNESILPVVSALRQTRRRMGILSNTCITHLEYCRRRFRVVRDCFELVVASCEVGMLKPEPGIYLCAAERAGVAPEEVFFADDIAANVEAASAAGFDAVRFTSARQLAAELRKRKIPMNL